MSEVKFYDRKELTALTVFHHSENELKEGLEILVERNLRTPLKPAKLISWQIGSVDYDITGYGKYSKSNCIVEIDGKNYQWPFSMIYVK